MLFVGTCSGVKHAIGLSTISRPCQLRRSSLKGEEEETFARGILQFGGGRQASGAKVGWKQDAFTETDSFARSLLGLWVSSKLLLSLSFLLY